MKLAQEELMETQRQLDKAKGKLAEVEEGIASLQAKYNECIAKKDDLEFKTNQCTARLVRAEKVSYYSFSCLLYYSSGISSRSPTTHTILWSKRIEFSQVYQERIGKEI